MPPFPDHARRPKPAQAVQPHLTPRAPAKPKRSRTPISGLRGTRGTSGARGQYIFPYSIEVDDRYVYVVETEAGAGNNETLSAIYRYELSQLFAAGDD